MQRGWEIGSGVGRVGDSFEMVFRFAKNECIGQVGNDNTTVFTVTAKMIHPWCVGVLHWYL